MTNVTRRQQYQERRYSPENLDEVRPICGRFRISYIVITCKYDATCQGAVALPLSNTHINRHWTHNAQIEAPTDQRIKLPRIMSPFHADWPMLMLSSIATLSISFIWFVLFRAQPLAVDKVLCHWRWTLCKALFWLLGQFLHSCSHLLCGFGLQVADVLTSSSFFYRLTVRRNANWFYIAHPHSKSFDFVAVETLQLQFIMFAMPCGHHHHPSLLPRNCNTISACTPHASSQAVLDAQSWILKHAY